MQFKFIGNYINGYNKNLYIKKKSANEENL